MPRNVGINVEIYFFIDHFTALIRTMTSRKELCVYTKAVFEIEIRKEIKTSNVILYGVYSCDHDQTSVVLSASDTYRYYPFLVFSVSRTKLLSSTID